MPFLKFYQTTNLFNPDMDEGYPWDFAPSNLAEFRGFSKVVRHKTMLSKDTQWNVYSAVRATAFNQRISSTNPPAGLRGLVADYDMKMSIPEVLNYLNQISPVFVPNYIEVSLSKRIRLVWVFEREILLPNKRFCDKLIGGFFDLIGVRTLLAGYDDKSEVAEQVWTNGGEWHDVKATPMPWATVFGVICKVSKDTEFGKSEVPLETIHAKIKEKFPGRWEGDFKLDATGVRFWDDRADNKTGCQVKPDGMLCFTGSVPFMKWEALFGASWVNDQRTTNLGKIAGDIYYDGHNYWEFKCGRWYSVDRCDVLLHLKDRGISGVLSKGTGETVSDAERVLAYIQNVNRIDGAAPLTSYRPGIVQMDSNRILNTSCARALDPGPEGATVEQFPWIWKFINGLFDRPEENAFLHFLAWLKRSYASLYRYEKTMGQAIFLCGPKENGKTLLCFKIIKPLLGNKIANPYDYFTGLTTFNSELFESPLLAINDEEAPSNDQMRQKFLARIKSFVVNPSNTFHQKYCKPVSVERTGRLFVTLNDDAASVGMLPEVNRNTSDKLMFFGSRPYAGEWEPSHIVESRIEKELPHFARWLLEWTPPDFVLTPGRMGIKSYFDPRILTLSCQQMSAYTLVEVLALFIETSAAWPEDKPILEITPEKLYSDLSGCETTKKNIAKWDGRTVHRALRTLSQLPDIGVELISDNGERLYKLTRAKLAKPQELKVA